MTVITKNHTTEVFDDRGRHVATVAPWLDGYALTFHDARCAFGAIYFSNATDAIYNAS